MALIIVSILATSFTVVIFNKNILGFNHFVDLDDSQLNNGLDEAKLDSNKITSKDFKDSVKVNNQNFPQSDFDKTYLYSNLRLLSFIDILENYSRFSITTCNSKDNNLQDLMQIKKNLQTNVLSFSRSID